MGISINNARCVACGACAAVCPGTLLETTAGEATRIRRPEDCWGCTACMKACPREAISLALAPSCGGRGGSLHVRAGKNLVHWRIIRHDGREWRLRVHRRDANRY